MQFIVEVEGAQGLPFLVVCMCKNWHGTLGWKVYQKATHTDLYLNGASFIIQPEMSCALYIDTHSRDYVRCTKPDP